MDSTQSTTSDSSSKQVRWDRDAISQFIQQIGLDQASGKSLNRSAIDHAVPRSSAQRWVRNRSNLKQNSGLALTTVEFFRITPRARVPT